MTAPQKPKLRQGGLTGTWYVVTSYNDDGFGSISVKRKRELHADDVRQLDLWAASTAALVRLVDALDGPGDHAEALAAARPLAAEAPS